MSQRNFKADSASGGSAKRSKPSKQSSQQVKKAAPARSPEQTQGHVRAQTQAQSQK